MLCQARSNRPFGRGRRCLSTHPHLPPSLLVSAILPSPPSPPLTWALPLAERWDSFTQAAGCQERSSPRKAGQMYVGHCESEGGFSFSSSLLFFLLLFVPLFFLALWLAPSLVMSEKITLICVCPVVLFFLFSWTSS